jgi:hypothetical protein
LISLTAEVARLQCRLRLAERRLALPLGGPMDGDWARVEAQLQIAERTLWGVARQNHTLDGAEARLALSRIEALDRSRREVG